MMFKWFKRKPTESEIIDRCMMDLVRLLHSGRYENFTAETRKEAGEVLDIHLLVFKYDLDGTPCRKTAAYGLELSAVLARDSVRALGWENAAE